MKKSPIIFAVIALCGCAGSYRVLPPKVQDDLTNTKVKSVPAIGEIHSVEIGENLYSEYVVHTHQTYTASLDDDTSGEMGLGNKINFKKGTSGPLTITYRGHYNSLCFDYITKSELNGQNNVCLVDKKRTGIFDYAMFKERERYFKLSNPAPYKIINNTPTFLLAEAKFKREALYEGVSKGVVKISFREFSNDMARPAFTQDVFYDLNADGTGSIAFKGLRVEILGVKGPKIKYRLLKPFEDSLAKAEAN